MHAWPELYFPGAGWVRFEPTPATRSGADDRAGVHGLPVRERADRPAQQRGALAGRRQPRADHRRQGQEPAGRSPAPRTAASRSRGAASSCGGGVLAVLVGLAFVPRLVRRRRREGRLGDGPEPVWIELRDTVVDLGLTWPAGRSPRETGSYLVHYFGRPPGEDTASRPRHGVDVSPEAEAALTRIVSTIEHQRYARPGVEPGRHPPGRRRDRDRGARRRRPRPGPSPGRVAAPVPAGLPPPPALLVSRPRTRPGTAGSSTTSAAELPSSEFPSAGTALQPSNAMPVR